MFMIHKAFQNNIKTIVKSSTLFLFILFTISTTGFVNAQDADGVPTDEAVINAGKALFENNCTQCHSVTDEVVVGPGLKNVHARRPIGWLIKWIRNSTLVIQSGDAYANEIYNKFGKTQMQSFDFKDEEIISIVAYVKSKSAAPAPVATAAAPEGGGQQTAATAPASQDTTTLTYVLFLFIVIMEPNMLMVYMQL